MGRIHPEGCELDSSLLLAGASVWARQEPDDDENDDEDEEEDERDTNDDDPDDEDDEGDGYSE
jgi:hypothetical protein